MFEPSGLTATPPRAPLMPPNNLPSAAAERSFVIGGVVRLTVQAVRACPEANAFTCRVP